MLVVSLPFFIWERKYKWSDDIRTFVWRCVK